MSTRSSIAGGDGFHIFTELMEDTEDVYLRLDKTWFSASPGSVTVKIPAAVWQTIRQYEIDLTMAALSDDALRARCEQEVDERIAKFTSAENPKVRAIVNFSGSAVYGGADQPKEAQVEEGFKYYSRIRAIQLKILEDQAKHRVYKRVGEDDDDHR